MDGSIGGNGKRQRPGFQKAAPGGPSSCTLLTFYAGDSLEPLCQRTNLLDMWAHEVPHGLERFSAP